MKSQYLCDKVKIFKLSKEGRGCTYKGSEWNKISYPKKKKKKGTKTQQNNGYNIHGENDFLLSIRDNNRIKIFFKQLREFIQKVENKKYDSNIYLEYEQNQKQLNYRKKGRDPEVGLMAIQQKQAKPKLLSCK